LERGDLLHNSLLGACGAGWKEAKNPFKSEWAKTKSYFSLLFGSERSITL
jgi:hypothetical protein